MKKILFVCTLITSLFFVSCENEPVGEAVIDLSNVIEVNSELYGLLQGIAGDPSQDQVACIDFQYAFTVFIFDEELEILDAEVINSDQEFSAFLASIPPEQSISVSYPITSTLANGEIFEVTNNEELKAAIDLCLRDELLGYCNNLLEECIWQVTSVTGGNTDYEGSYFDVSEIGVVGYFLDNNVFDGTWITYYIEDELHLNINLVDGSPVAADWNFDWRVVIPDDDHMELSQGDVTVIIEKQCPSGCQQYDFEQCEISGSGTAFFPLDSYIECFLPFVDGQPTDLLVSFHLTQEDANNNVNPLSSPYMNVENPQIIYVRAEDEGTGLIYYLSIIIRAIPCDV